MMKLSNPLLWLFFTLLSLAGILSLLGYRDALRQSALIYLPNSTYFLLASDDPYTRTKMSNDVKQLLYQPSPVLRQSLLQWWRNRQFPPVIMSALPGFARRNPSCAVVGNSGILIGSRHGHSIDSHSIVIRLNNAPVRGHERDVGSKTNLSFINSNILHECYWHGGSCNCHPYGPSVPIVMYICQAAHFLDYLACNSSVSLQITDIRFDMLCARIAKYYSIKRFVQATGKPLREWANFRHPMHFHYSSGMQAVMLAMGICDRVAVFGFGKSSNAKHHYHTNQSKEQRVHDYEAEYEFYRDLVQRPKAIPFLWDSGFSLPHLIFYH